MCEFSTNTKEDYDASFIEPNENIQTGEFIVKSRTFQYHKGLRQEIVIFRIGNSKLKKIHLSYIIGAATESQIKLNIFKNPQDEKSEIIDGLWAKVIDGELKIIKSTFFQSDLNVDEGAFTVNGYSNFKDPKDNNNENIIEYIFLIIHHSSPLLPSSSSICS